MKKENKRKVFVVNRSSHDFSDAEKYGELVFMTEGTVPRLASSNMHRAFKEFLDDSKPDDFILLTSLNIMCSIACGMFGAIHKRLNLLVWTQNSRGDRSGKYISRIIVFN